MRSRWLLAPTALFIAVFAGTCSDDNCTTGNNAGWLQEGLQVDRSAPGCPYVTEAWGELQDVSFTVFAPVSGSGQTSDTSNLTVESNEYEGDEIGTYTMDVTQPPPINVTFVPGQPFGSAVIVSKFVYLSGAGGYVATADFTYPFYASTTAPQTRDSTFISAETPEIAQAIRNGEVNYYPWFGKGTSQAWLIMTGSADSTPPSWEQGPDTTQSGCDTDCTDDGGEGQTWTRNVGRNPISYRYDWWMDNTLVGTAQTITNPSWSAGRHTLASRAQRTDNTYEPVASKTIVVKPWAPIRGVHSMYVGNEYTFHTDVHGTSNYTLLWQAGSTSGKGTTFVWGPTKQGTFAINLTVHDNTTGLTNYSTAIISAFCPPPTARVTTTPLLQVGGGGVCQ